MTVGNSRFRWKVPLLALALAALTGCGSSGTSAGPGRPPATPTSQAPYSSLSSPSGSSPGSSPGPTAGSTAAPPSPTPTPSPASTSAPPTTAPSATATPVPSASPFPVRLAGVDWERIPTTRPVVALTFDAGANADAVPSILATLHRYGVPATFFLTGDFVRQFPDAARQIAADQRVGNHSVDHPYFTKLTNAEIAVELAGARQRIQAVTGDDPRPLFRFPYGDRDARTIAAVNAAGYVPVRWTVDTLGWEGTSGGITEQAVYDRTLRSLRPGEIVLMHCGSNPTDHSTLDAAALGRIIQAVKDRGYGFVTLDALPG